MGIWQTIRGLFRRDATTRESFLRPRANSLAGETVTVDSATQLSAVSACVQVISEDIATIPWFVYERTDKGRVKAESHPVYRLLHDWPNDDMSSADFREALVINLLLHGNAYAFIDKNNARPVELLPLHPKKVKVRRVNGSVQYQAQIGDKWLDVPTDQIFHVKAFSADGLIGRSVIEYAANTIGVALAVDKFASKFFAKGTTLSGYLTSTGKLDPGLRSEMKNSWAEMQAGVDNAFDVPVFGNGVKYEALGVPPEQSQFLQTKQYQVVDIARLFRIAPPKIGDLTKANYNTLEQSSISHVRDCLRPRIVKLDQEANRKLFLENEREKFYCEMEPAALMRGDTASQNADFALGLQWGWYNRNEVRRLKNMPEIEGGDIFNMPLNMAPLAEVQPEPDDKPKDDQQPADEPQDEADQQEQDKQEDRFAPLVADTATRIAVKITRALERESSKFSLQPGADLPNSRNSLVAWLDNYLADKALVFRSTIEPLSRSMNPANADIAADNFAEEIRSKLTKQLEDALAFDAFPEFKASIAKYIADTFKETHGTQSAI